LREQAREVRQRSASGL